MNYQEAKGLIKMHSYFVLTISKRKKISPQLRKAVDWAKLRIKELKKTNRRGA